MMLLVLLLLLNSVPVLAQSPGTFFNPPPAVNNQQGFQSNPTWTVGDTQSVQWTTIYSNYTIVLWQQVLGKGVALKGPSIFETETGVVTEFNWNVQNFEFDLNQSTVFFLWLQSGPYAANGDGSTVSVTSHYFNITAASSSSISSGTSSSTVPSTPSSAAIATSAASSAPPSLMSSVLSSATIAPTVATNIALSTSSGLSSSAKVGIGFGAVIGIFIASAVGAFVTWRFHKKNKRLGSGPELQPQQFPPQSQQNTGGTEAALKPSYPAEVESTFELRPAELY